MKRNGDGTPPEERPTMPGRNGGTLRRGGTNRGGPGRLPNAWKQECARLAHRGAQIAAARGVLENPDHPAWLGAWKFVAEQAYGRAQQRLEVAGDTQEPLKIIVRKEMPIRAPQAPVLMQTGPGSSPGIGPIRVMPMLLPGR